MDLFHFVNVLWYIVYPGFTETMNHQCVTNYYQNTAHIAVNENKLYIYIQLMCVPQWFVCKHARSIEGHKPCISTFFHLSKIKKVFHICQTLGATFTYLFGVNE